MSTTLEHKKQITWDDCKDCFAIPGRTMVDLIHPITGKSVHAGQTLDEIRQRYPEAVKMTVEAFQKSKAAEQDTPIIWTETTEEKYWEMLEVLPPIGHTAGGFLVGEPTDHHAVSGRPRFAAYRQCNGKYYAANRPLTCGEFHQETLKPINS